MDKSLGFQMSYYVASLFKGLQSCDLEYMTRINLLYKPFHAVIGIIEALL